jgi:hypothetical protein
LNFLPASSYPFRFHYSKHNSNFLENQLSSATTGRRSLGFNWSLRTRKFPKLSVNYDNTSYDSRYLASSLFRSDARSLNLALSHNLQGWEISSAYGNQASTEGITDLKTRLNFLRLDARRPLSKKSSLFVNSFFEKLHFASGATRLLQDFSFFDVHTDFSTQHTSKLKTRVSHQFYKSATVQNSSLDRALVSDQGNAILIPPAVTSFNALEGQVTYNWLRYLNVSASGGARMINLPEQTNEVATRFLDFAVIANWNKKIKFVNTRASYQEGIQSVESNRGIGRRVEFRSYSAGLSGGNVKRLLITADYSSSLRPDAFQIGGFFSQRAFNVGVETTALGSLYLRVSAGESDLDYLTSSGRERFRTATFLASLDHKRMTMLVSRNANLGVRGSFVIPFASNPDRVFRILPISSLIRDPLLNTSGVYTLGLLRLKPAADFEVELRFLKDQVKFVRAADVSINQFDLLAKYRLGKITVTGGAIFSRQQTEGLFSRNRGYIFFRLSRPFKIF